MFSKGIEKQHQAVANGLSKKPHPPLLNQWSISRWITNQNHKKSIYALLTFYFKFWRYIILLLKIQSPDLLAISCSMLFILTLQINRYHFSQIFRASFIIIWKKKIFCTNFHFSMDSRLTQHPAPSPPTRLTALKSAGWQKFFVYEIF